MEWPNSRSKKKKLDFSLRISHQKFEKRSWMKWQVYTTSETLWLVEYNYLGRFPNTVNIR